MNVFSSSDASQLKAVFVLSSILRYPLEEILGVVCSADRAEVDSDVMSEAEKRTMVS